MTRNDLEKPTHRPKDRTIRILQKARDELVCSGRVSSSCSTNRTRRIIIKPHQHHVIWNLWVRVMAFNATFNNISVISWQSVLLMEETEKTIDLPQITAKLYHSVEYTSPWTGFKLTTLSVICTDYKGSCKSNVHTMTTTTVPRNCS